MTKYLNKQDTEIYVFNHAFLLTKVIYFTIEKLEENKEKESKGTYICKTYSLLKFWYSF